MNLPVLKNIDLKKILNKMKFDSLGIKNFGAIPLNQIPGDKESTEGHNVRGTYWTLPDESGKEAIRDKPIDETKYTQLVSDFQNTYFEEVYKTLKKKFKIFSKRKYSYNSFRHK